VFDDGSVDETIEIIEAFCEISPFKVLIHRNEPNPSWTKKFFENSLNLFRRFNLPVGPG
jgi:hypothetical protein